MLNRYETLYFKLRQKPRNICDPASSNHHISGMLHGKKNYGLDISQLRVLASHTGSLRSVAQGALELESWEIRRCYFLSDPCVYGYIF